MSNERYLMEVLENASISDLMELDEVKEFLMEFFSEEIQARKNQEMEEIRIQNKIDIMRGKY